ncbi:MAG: hypothetical protein HYZ58_18350 [Acidobacteria bacterium]|nr:hypothetical protein [Acidobacteriota bacterium]
MKRHLTLVLAGLLVALAGAVGPAFGQDAAKTKYIAPIKGEARIGYTKPQVKVVKDAVITVIKVKNMTTGRIAGFKVEEFWWDKQRNPVTGARYIHPRPIDPGEVITVTLNTPKNPAMDSNNYTFTHAQGTIKATAMKSLDEAPAEGKAADKGKKTKK